MADRLVEAAGGLVWRPADNRTGVEIAVIHRPKYDDWSLPKGKLLQDEHPLLGAVREVVEETGCRATVGRPLGETRYTKDGQPKRVRYWSMRAIDGEFVPGDEVDELRWLAPNDAQGLLSPDRDREILDTFLRDMSETWACVLLRHGNAGERGSWAGDDHDRPLDDLGHRQAAALAEVLGLNDVRRVVSSDVLRCLDTVEPYAAAKGLHVETEPLFSETGYVEQPDAAFERLLDIACSRQATAVCSQGKTIPDLLARTCEALGHPPPGDTTVRKSGWWTLHMTANGSPRLIDVERFPPVGVSVA